MGKKVGNGLRQDLWGGVMSHPEDPTLATHGAVVISPRSTVVLFSNVPYISCVPCKQHGFVRLLLSLSHCMIVTDDFKEVSHVSPVSSIQDAIFLRNYGMTCSLCKTSVAAYFDHTVNPECKHD